LAEQEKALAAVVKTLSPAFLTLPEPLLGLLPPRPPGLPRTRESFASQTGLTFDPVAAAESAADLTLTVLFNAQRASRVVEYHARNAAEPSLNEVMDAALTAARPTASAGGLSDAVANAVYVRTVESLLSLAANGQTSAEARAVVLAKLDGIKAVKGSPVDAYVSARIVQLENDPAKFVPAVPVEAPPGMPIGDDEN